eukprot:1009023-Rhodomonas_salina.1
MVLRVRCYAYKKQSRYAYKRVRCCAYKGLQYYYTMQLRTRLYSAVPGACCYAYHATHTGARSIPARASSRKVPFTSPLLAPPMPGAGGGGRGRGGLERGAEERGLRRSTSTLF